MAPEGRPQQERSPYELRAGEERFRRYFELGLIGMAITRPTKELVEVNDRICQILGYERDELLRLTWPELTHPEDLAADVAEFNRVLAGDIDGYSIDKRFIRKDGQIIDTTISVKCLRGADGTVDEFVSLLQDVTEQKRAHSLLERRVAERTDELVAVNRKIETILDGITDNVYGLSSDWRITYLNRHARGVMTGLGKDPAQLIGKTIWEVFPDTPDEADLRRAMSERVSISNEIYYPLTGQWFENYVNPSADGGLLTVQRCIDDRKRMEMKLRRSETYLAEAERLSGTGSGALNVATGELFWSDESHRLCGFEPGTITPTWDLFVQLVHPDDRARVEQNLVNVCREKRDYEVSFRIVRPDGAVRHIQSFGHPAFDETGEVTEIIGMVLDVTERRHAEEERTQLLRRVMTAQEEERRRLSREMHDQFGQQLTALSLKLATLKHACGEDPPLLEQIQSLEAIARQLDADVGSVVWSLRPTSLDDLGLAAALANFVTNWSKRFDIRAELHTSGVEKERLADTIETALYRVTQEALTNIARHAGASNVAVLLERHPGHVSLIVEDDGSGFEAERAMRAGEGLGLVGMRERAMLVGGTLGIESRPGEGTTIVVRVPVPDRSGGANGG